MTEFDPTALAAETARLLDELYVFPEQGRRTAERLRDHIEQGRYRDLTDPEALAALLTEDMRAVTPDPHLRVIHHPEPMSRTDDHALMMDRMRARAAATMNGVAGVDRIDGDIAHLRLSPLLFPLEIGGESMVAAMNLVAPARALVLDLRDTHGGDPRVVSLLCGYLFDEPVHLMDFYQRRGDTTRQSWSAAYVPGPRFGGTKPIRVLIGPETFSAGEELANDLKRTGRARLIGETTRGGANPRIGVGLHPHLELSVPTGRGIDPDTGGNWEGVGVAPDLAVPAAEALETAVAELAAVGQ